MSTTDLREKEGSTLRMGEPLFEVAEMNNLRVQIDLNERDVQRIRDSTSGNASIGEIRTTSRTDQPHPIIIDRIVPNDQPKEGENTFLVYGHVDMNKVDERVARTWSPGQGGEVAINEEPRSLMYQWTHRLVDWARLKLWIF